MFFIKNKRFLSKKYPKTSFFFVFEIEKTAISTKNVPPGINLRHQQPLLDPQLSSKAIAHSERKLLTGLPNAARMACQLTVTRQISKLNSIVSTNTQMLSEV